MDAWFHCENPYPFVPDEVLDASDSVRASLPNRYCDPKVAARLFEGARERVASWLLTIMRSKHGGRLCVRLNSSSLNCYGRAEFTLTHDTNGLIVCIASDAMRRPKEQREVRYAGSAFSTSEMLVLDGVAWEQFIAALETPPRPIPELVELFRGKAPWD